MLVLSPHTVLRPEPQGAILFQRERAETAFLDMEGLEALYALCSPTPVRETPLDFLSYLLARGFLVRDRGTLPEVRNLREGAREDLAACLESARLITAPPRSLTAPETIHFAVTGRCDQACAGCFYSARPGSSVAAQDASWELYQHVIAQAAQAQVLQIALGGGEPLLHPKLVDMVRLARESGLVPNLTTNGNRLTLEMAVALKEAGLGQVQISLNGANEETNRQTRPNYVAALAAAHACQTAGLRFGLNFLLTRSSAEELEPVFRLGQQLGAATVNILRPKPPVVEGDWLARESLDSDGYRRVAQVLRELPRSPQSAIGNPQSVITLDASLVFLLTHHSPETLYERGIWGCSAARKFVTVSQDGAVYPCSHVRWSDVGGGDFMRAWRESAVFARFRAQEDEMRGRCRACPHLSLCRGCRAVVLAGGGEFGDSDPHCPRVG